MPQLVEILTLFRVVRNSQMHGGRVLDQVEQI
jgi:hypothetical protein